MKPEILITGVAGLLGSRLADWIISNQSEYNVIGIDNLSGGYESNIPKGIHKFYKIDLSANEGSEDIRLLEKVFTNHNIRYVYHFAAYAAEGLSPFMRHFNYSNNIISTVEILNRCIRFGIKRLIYASSMSVYGHGKLNGEPFDEDFQLSPIDPYGISKYACEMDIQVAGEQHNLDWCIVRPHNIYGINQNIWDKYRNVIGIWMNRILRGEPALIYGDGEQARAFTYVDDILPCLWKAAESPECSKEVINLGGIVPYTINDVAEELRKVVEADGISVKFEFREPRYEVRFVIPSWQKSVDLLGFEHKTLLEDGLRNMWEWAKLQPDRPLQTWDKYELDVGMYSYWK